MLNSICARVPGAHEEFSGAVERYSTDTFNYAPEFIEALRILMLKLRKNRLSVDQFKQGVAVVQSYAKSLRF